MGQNLYFTARNRPAVGGLLNTVGLYQLNIPFNFFQ